MISGDQAMTRRDFVVDGCYAVEVTRLNHRISVGGGAYTVGEGGNSATPDTFYRKGA